MTKTQTTPSLISLGLTFVFVGLGFAFPVFLFPEKMWIQSGRASEVLNLFCLVAWMGMSHFVFAYRGHFKASRAKGFLGIYIAVLVLSAAALFGLRHYMGYAIFSAVAWVYFISHLLRAEMYFAGEKDWRLFLFPLISFTYFSAAMLGPLEWITPISLFAGAAVSFLPMVFGGKSMMKNELFKPLFLLGMFLIGETLLWGTYRPHMTENFSDGVYTVHVALASFYHYFKSYSHMLGRGQGSLRTIIAVNLIVIAAGILTQFYLGFTPLIYLLGFQFFTVWVWLHQWMSDWFNWKMRIKA